MDPSVCGQSLGTRRRRGVSFTHDRSPLAKSRHRRVLGCRTPIGRRPPISPYVERERVRTKGKGFRPTLDPFLQFMNPTMEQVEQMTPRLPCLERQSLWCLSFVG